MNEHDFIMRYRAASRKNKIIVNILLFLCRLRLSWLSFRGRSEKEVSV